MVVFTFSISESELCQTFKDVISIPLSFDLKYLWIDLLCIIQDDMEDWAQNPSLMSGVYGNSYLNIAAAGATDGSQGCLFLGQDLERVNAFQVRQGLVGRAHL